MVPLREDVPVMVAEAYSAVASPKSARQAWKSALMRMFALRDRA